MVNQFYSNPYFVRRLYEGPLGPYLDGFAASLSAKGYLRETGRKKLHLAGNLSDWIERERIKIEDLNEQKVSKFLKDRSKHKRIQNVDRSALRDLLEQLRAARIVPKPETKIDDTPTRRIESAFTKYLTQERGLSRSTTNSYIQEIRLFLVERFGSGSIKLNELNPQDIAQSILRRAHIDGSGCAIRMASALRSFCRFMYQHGETAIDLAASVPTVANYRLSKLPQYMEPDEVERLLQACDRSSPAGRRDYAILLLLARLGLRAGEVVCMELGDLNWDAGELVVRGKSHRIEKLPIPQDVGEALTDYLRHGRPPCSSRRVFIRAMAPRRGFSTSTAIAYIVGKNLKRAGLNPSRTGAHLLRHSLATRMLRCGASLSEIGEILRHQRMDTTEIYAKVDLNSLHALAQPWIGGKA